MHQPAGVEGELHDLVRRADRAREPRLQILDQRGPEPWPVRSRLRPPPATRGAGPLRDDGVDGRVEEVLERQGRRSADSQSMTPSHRRSTRMFHVERSLWSAVSGTVAPSAPVAPLEPLEGRGSLGQCRSKRPGGGENLSARAARCRSSTGSAVSAPLLDPGGDSGSPPSRREPSRLRARALRISPPSRASSVNSAPSASATPIALGTTAPARAATAPIRSRRKRSSSSPAVPGGLSLATNGATSPSANGWMTSRHLSAGGCG